MIFSGPLGLIQTFLHRHRTCMEMNVMMLSYRCCQWMCKWEAAEETNSPPDHNYLLRGHIYNLPYLISGPVLQMILWTVDFIYFYAFKYCWNTKCHIASDKITLPSQLPVAPWTGRFSGTPQETLRWRVQSYQARRGYKFATTSKFTCVITKLMTSSMGLLLRCISVWHTKQINKQCGVSYTIEILWTSNSTKS